VLALVSSLPTSRDRMGRWSPASPVPLVVERMKPPVGATLPKQERQLRTRPLSFSCHPPSRTRSVYKGSPSSPQSAERTGIRHSPLVRVPKERLVLPRCSSVTEREPRFRHFAEITARLAKLEHTAGPTLAHVPEGKRGRAPYAGPASSASSRAVSCLRFLAGRRSLARRRCSCKRGVSERRQPVDTRRTVPIYRLHDTTGDDFGLLEHFAPNLEPGVMLADGREALVSARVEAEPGPLVALLEVAIAPTPVADEESIA
jgi:hypothetical protein